MRCSGWSSLAILVCSALVLAVPAAAHVYPTPSYVPGGKTSTLALSVPNERDVPMSAVTLTVPEGFRVVGAQPAGGWTAAVTDRSATWSGGELPGRGTANLTVELEAPAEPGSVSLLAEETYPDGGVVRWPVAVTVVPGDEASQNLRAALVVGILGLLVITALALLLRRRRPRSLQEK
jgi:uncharacterized protein YcnI